MRKKIEYGYKNKAGKNLLELLRNISKNHCMYCYALLKSDRVDTGNLEHSIEKKLDEEHLEECVQNIALTCSHCNQSLKGLEKKNVVKNPSTDRIISRKSEL